MHGLRSQGRFFTCISDVYSCLLELSQHLFVVILLSTLFKIVLPFLVIITIAFLSAFEYTIFGSESRIRPCLFRPRAVCLRTLPFFYAFFVSFLCRFQYCMRFSRFRPHLPIFKCDNIACPPSILDNIDTVRSLWYGRCSRRGCGNGGRRIYFADTAGVVRNLFYFCNIVKSSALLGVHYLYCSYKLFLDWVSICIFEFHYEICSIIIPSTGRLRVMTIIWLVSFVPCSCK